MREFAVLARRTLLFVTAAVLAAAQAWPAAAAGMVLLYEIHSGGFSVGSDEVAVHLDEEGGYRIRNSLQTRGLIGFMTGFVSESESQGRIDGTAAVPVIHRTDNLWRGNKRWIRASYHEGAAPMLEVMPPAAEDDRDPVPSEQTVATVDPVTAGLSLALAAGDAKPGRVIAVFDGRRRYDLAVTALRTEPVSERVYQGQAVRMDIHWRRIGGFGHPGFFTPTRMAENATLWFAPARPESLNLPLPVRVESDSPFGATIIRIMAVRPAG